jgi:hypothetical protein
MNKDLRNSFLISFLYVGSGTLALLFMNLTDKFVLFVLTLTIPVNFIGFGIAYTEQNSTLPIIIVQLAVFLLFWRILYRRLKKRTARTLKR